MLTLHLCFDDDQDLDIKEGEPLTVRLHTAPSGDGATKSSEDVDVACRVMVS